MGFGEEWVAVEWDGSTRLCVSAVQKWVALDVGCVGCDVGTANALVCFRLRVPGGPEAWVPTQPVPLC